MKWEMTMGNITAVSYALDNYRSIRASTLSGHTNSVVISYLGISWFQIKFAQYQEYVGLLPVIALQACVMNVLHLPARRSPSHFLLGLYLSLSPSLLHPLFCMSCLVSLERSRIHYFSDIQCECHNMTRYFSCCRFL